MEVVCRVWGGMERLALSCCRGGMLHGLTGKGKGFGNDALCDGSQNNHHNMSHFKRPFPGKTEGLFINITYK